MQIKVVHKRDKQELAHRVYIGRPSPLGNPFVMKDESQREKVIREYKLWLWNEMKSGRWQELDRLRNFAKTGGVELECFCAPKPCHGDVIKAAIEWLDKNLHDDRLNGGC